jgi:hypothetical protein
MATDEKMDRYRFECEGRLPRTVRPLTVGTVCVTVTATAARADDQMAAMRMQSPGRTRERHVLPQLALPAGPVSKSRERATRPADLSKRLITLS